MPGCRGNCPCTQSPSVWSGWPRQGCASPRARPVPRKRGLRPARAPLTRPSLCRGVSDRQRAGVQLGTGEAGARRPAAAPEAHGRGSGGGRLEDASSKRSAPRPATRWGAEPSPQSTARAPGSFDLRRGAPAVARARRSGEAQGGRSDSAEPRVGSPGCPRCARGPGLQPEGSVRPRPAA